MYFDPYWQYYNQVDKNWLLAALVYYVFLFIIGTTTNGFVVFYYIK
jgi:hypothetical protein